MGLMVHIHSMELEYGVSGLPKYGVQTESHGYRVVKNILQIIYQYFTSLSQLSTAIML